MKRTILLLLLFCFFIPAFAGEKIFYTLDNKRLSHAKLISGSNTILFIWTTWCPGCRRELEKLSQKYISFDDIEVWYIATGENKSTVARFVDSKKLITRVRERIVLDKDNFIAQEFSVSGIPTFIFFKNSKPVYKSYFLNDEVLKRIFGEG